MLESILSQSTSASRHEKYWIYLFSQTTVPPNLTLKLCPKTLMLDFKNEYCIQITKSVQFYKNIKAVTKGLRRKVEVIGNAML